MKWVDRKFAHPRGEWTIEPDHKEWIDPITRFECEAKRRPHGAWSGSVTIPYSAFRAQNIAMYAQMRGLLRDILVRDYKHYHHAEVRLSDQATILVFDCARMGDYIPNSCHLLNSGTTYRNLAYVEAECTRICHQALVILNTVIV